MPQLRPISAKPMNAFLSKVPARSIIYSEDLPTYGRFSMIEGAQEEIGDVLFLKIFKYGIE